MNDTSWLDNFIGTIEQAYNANVPVIVTDLQGNKTAVTIGQDLLTVLKANQPMLIKIGQETFKQFLLLMHAQQQFDALVLIYDKLDYSDLIAQAQGDAVQLAQIAATAQAEHAFWMELAKQLAIKAATGALGLLL